MPQKPSVLNERKPLLPLATETNYLAAEFEYLEYFGSQLTGSEAILRLNLKNGTTIDVPCSDNQLQHLMISLCESFPERAVSYVRGRWPQEA
jgi:hypothetical protein